MSQSYLYEEPGRTGLYDLANQIAYLTGIRLGESCRAYASARQNQSPLTSHHEFRLLVLGQWTRKLRCFMPLQHQYNERLQSS